MKTTVKLLVSLQEIDKRFDELQLQKGDLPMMIEEAEENLKEKIDRKKELEERLEKGSADRKMFQMEIDASKEKLKVYEEQLYQVTTNKEYDAISLEIDTKKMEINELENKILQSLEEEEEIKNNIVELDKEIEQLENLLKEYKEELEEINQHTREEEARLSKEREKIVAEMNSRLYHQYERIRKAKEGLAVARIQRGSCGGCFSSIPPQKIVEIRELNRLHTCEHCGRILVWVDENGET